KRDSSYYENGIDDSWWIEAPGEPLTPKYLQGTPSDGDFKTSLFNVKKSTQSVQWGGLVTGGLEYENQSLEMTYLYTRTTQDSATLAEDTRGKAYFFPGYDPNDPSSEGNEPNNLSSAPYLRTETLQYTERKIESVIFHGDHRLPIAVHGLGRFLKFNEPELDWTLSDSSADLYQPDKRQFGALWWAESDNPGVPPWVPPFVDPAHWYPFKPAANYTLGNFQRIYKEINEKSDQYSMNLKLPFEQWSGEEGFLKFGLFSDKVDRKFNQDTFSNFNDASAEFEGEWEEYWSGAFPHEDHPITDGPPYVDVDYTGDQKVSAWYSMMDIPITSCFSLIGGVRFESTEIGIVNDAEENATWYPKGEIAPVTLNPGDADVNFSQSDRLPSIGFELAPWKRITLRGSYSETVARQTFKELTPIMQQEYLGGPIFIGNPDLQMAELQNYDLRLDLTPYDGGLVSLSYFYKNLDKPIEYVQRLTSFDFTTAENYPKGELKGYEFEVRQNLGHFWEKLDGLSLGGNATMIRSEVTLPDEEAALFLEPSIAAPMWKRDATGAPEYIYNTFLTYDLNYTGTQVGLFYTVTGDTLVAGAGQSNGFLVPDVYAKKYATVNFSLTQKIGQYLKLRFQAKNLNDPVIETVYRSSYLPEDKTKTSYTKGVDYAVSLSAEFRF
ncbi:MAG: TonB-dependent receptor, partial [Planctomycetota bacterium]